MTQPRLTAGFTLIELMIVVAIIGILASIAIPQYQLYIARAQFAECNNLLGGARVPVEERLTRFGTLRFAQDFEDVFALRAALGVGIVGKHSGLHEVNVAEQSVEISCMFGAGANGLQGEDAHVTSMLAGNTISYRLDFDPDSGAWQWSCSGVTGFTADELDRVSSGLCEDYEL
ncbi:pilin [Natronospira bacteriovora]|uniref:Prepilin-type N-terminal cleavage/methylation domain-containing protein n=1 Tax=Natronospira bacteriovora TaxID=3069753 RepID=A0ABU0W651_9GAMM|nr:prepilin-type N-terminal cleavage/methylation domain-containing protein [Natronospira sp. AB-CW4]MDQ2069489.1 prepilin-type N-terminal cleavage/methylation domain-containing protein [Natronospira sp. AB-CW4]